MIRLHRFVRYALISPMLLALAGCSAVQQGVGVLSDAGGIASEAKAAADTAGTIRSTFADISEEEEYYIGRSVAAIILHRYPVYPGEALTAYVNTLGTVLAGYSDRPEIYAGYHFLVLDTEEVNALAAPGGFVFLSRGLIKRCRNEEMLAAVLAHEIGHVCAKHGLQSIKKSRLVDAFRMLGSEAVERYGPAELAQLTDVFENVLGDIAESLIERGYDRKYEYEADRLSVKFASNTGYDPGGLLDFLQTMVENPAAGGGSAAGWFKTHPSASDRLAEVRREIQGLSSVPAIDTARTERFAAAVKALKE